MRFRIIWRGKVIRTWEGELETPPVSKIEAEQITAADPLRGQPTSANAKLVSC
jgi:hypothetical protein